jgi:hypothetical protein
MSFRLLLKYITEPDPSPPPRPLLRGRVLRSWEIP